MLEHPIRGMERTKRAKEMISPKWRASKEQAPLPLAEVNLTAPDGFLWQPTSIMPPTCEGGKKSGKEIACEAKVNFCLIKIREYQKTPWTYPMAAMLQKGSECSKAENRRLYMLSTLRVRPTFTSSTCPFFFLPEQCPHGFEGTRGWAVGVRCDVGSIRGNF